jgi:hypothetical protein
MAIPGVCPSCGSKFDLPQALTDAEARQALGAALALPAPLARQVVPYMALLAPKGKAISMGKLARLLSELTQLVTEGKVTRKGETYGCPLELWQAGIMETLNARDAGSLILPLKDHAYLTEIVWRMAAKASQQAKQRTVSHPSHRPGLPSDMPSGPKHIGSIDTVKAALKGNGKPKS